MRDGHTQERKKYKKHIQSQRPAKKR